MFKPWNVMPRDHDAAHKPSTTSASCIENPKMAKITSSTAGSDCNQKKAERQ